MADFALSLDHTNPIPKCRRKWFKVQDEKYEDFIIPPATEAGDVILFSESTVHGAKSWTIARQRRTALYRFSPATNVYGRSYMGHEGGGRPNAMYEGLTEAQRAVLEPPYADRLDRPNIQPDGSVEITKRSARIGSKYLSSSCQYGMVQRLGGE